MGIKVEQIKVENTLKNFNYLIINEKTSDCWVIDPYNGEMIEEYLDDLSLSLKGIFNTHSHFDHIKGNNYLIERYQVEAKLPVKDSFFELTDNSILKAFFLPGHSLDHICYLLEEKEKSYFFSGDLIFSYGVGNIRNGGNIEMLFESLDKVKKNISKEAIFYPGHDYEKTNKEFSQFLYPRELKATQINFSFQLKNNIFLNLDDKDLQKNVSKKINKKISTEKELLVELRNLRDKW